MADDTTRGVHLNEKQLVFVLMAAGVICGVMFLFGVLVGRGVPNDRGPGADGAMISPSQVVPDPQPASEPAGAKAVATPADDFTYAKRLSQPDAPAEPLKTPAPASSPVAAGAAPPAATPAGGATSPDVPQPPPDPPDETPAAGRAEATATGSFTVQVAAVKKRGDADVVVKRLKARGYEARVSAPEAGDRTGVFRVKVGTYKTRREADAVARKIENEGQYKPWVTR